MQYFSSFLHKLHLSSFSQLFISTSNSIIPQNNSTRRFATDLQDKEYSTWSLSTTHNRTPTVKKNVVCSSSNRKLNFIKTYNSKQNNQANQASLPSTSTKVASAVMSCDLQSRLWMLLYSGLPIAELTRTLLTNTWNRGTRGTEEHEEQENTRNTRTWGTWGEAKTKSMPKRPTLAWNKIQFVTLPPPPEKKTMSTLSFG